MAGRRKREGSASPVTIIGSAAAILILVLAAYLGTGLSMTVQEYNTTEVPFIGVGFDVSLKNDGLLTQTKTVHCEVRTSSGVYDASKEVTLGPGESTDLIVIVPILGLDTNDIKEKKCSTSLL